MAADKPLMTLMADLGAPVEVGLVGGLVRRLIPITGGTVSGDHAGVILPGGADWQTVAPDGQFEIAARYILQLSEGLVEVQSTGLRFAPPEVQAKLARGEAPAPGEVYFRTAMRFWSAAPELDYLNHLMAIATGRRLASQVVLDVFKAP